MKTLLLGLMLLSSTVFAKEGGNGGDGIKIGGKIYLLDLVEAGVEMDPYFDRGTQIDPKILDRVKKALVVAPIVQELIVMKLTEIHKISPITALSILKAIEAYSFRFVARELVNVADEDTSLQYDQDMLVQLAIRRDRIILVNRNTWNQLNPENQTALIFHEMIYAMTPIVQNGQGDYKQPSDLARQVVGYLFHKDLCDKGFEGLYAITRNGKVLLVDSSKLEEQGNGTACFGKGARFFNNTNTVDSEIMFDLNDSADEISKKANKYCSDIKFAINYLTSVQGVDPIRTNAYDVTSNFSCQKVVGFYYEDYQENIGTISKPNIVVKSRYSAVEELHQEAYVQELEKFQHGITVTQMNVGTRRHSELRWTIDDSACVGNIKSQLKKYLE